MDVILIFCATNKLPVVVCHISIASAKPICAISPAVMLAKVRFATIKLTSFVAWVCFPSASASHSSTEKSKRKREREREREERELDKKREREQRGKAF